MPMGPSIAVVIGDKLKAQSAEQKSAEEKKLFTAAAKEIADAVKSGKPEDLAEKLKFFVHACMSRYGGPQGGLPDKDGY